MVDKILMAVFCAWLPAAVGAKAVGVELERVPVPQVIDSQAVVEPRAGEDGTPYPEAGIDRPGWRMGVIDPEVDADAVKAETLRVVVLLRGPDVGLDRELTEIRARHRSVLRDLAGQVRALDRIARGVARGLSEDDERRHTLFPVGGLSRADRVRRHQLLEQLDMRLHALRTEVSSRLRVRLGPVQERVTSGIRAAGGAVHARVDAAHALGATIPTAWLDELARHPDVRAILKEPTPRLSLNVSVPTTGYGTWHAGSLDGSGVWDGGQIDSAIAADHPAFSHLTFYTDVASPTVTNGHGTHVAGIIASADTTYLGTAPSLDGFFWSILGGGLSNAMNRMETLATAFADSPEVINFSANFNRAAAYDYNDEGEFFDTFVQNYNLLLTISAGNAGWDDTAPTLGSPAHAYNVLSVASMADFNSIDRSVHLRRSDSSVGPTFFGRRKPDLAAPGDGIMSSNAFWNGSPPGAISCGAGSDADFVSCGGTSMAAPHVAGAVVLLEDGGNHEPMAQRAVLINTADWWDSNDTETTTDDGPVLTPGPPGTAEWDKSYGWGYIDMQEAYFNRTDYFVDSVVARNDTAVEDDYKLYKGPMLAGEKATLTWEKRGVYSGNSVPTVTYALTDLNLRLYDEDNGSLVDYDLSNRDNVHQVKAAEQINAVVKVYSFSATIGGASAEPFALATEEAFVEVPFPEMFQGIGSWPSKVAADTEIDISFRIRNDSELASHLNQFQIIPPPGWTLVSGSNPVVVGSAAGSAGSSPTATWRLRAQSVPQNGVEVFVDHSHVSYLESSGMQRWRLSLDVVDCTLAGHCNDGLYCNGIELCFNNTCQPGSPPDCDDANPCTVDSCSNSDASCVNTPTEFPPAGIVGKDGIAPLSWVPNSVIALQWGSVPDATYYSVQTGAVGVLPNLASSATDSCEDLATGATSVHAMIDTPPAGETLFYLVAAGNQCGLGPVGPGSTGPRQHDSAGACGTSCAQDKCAAGVAMDPACDPCVAQICAVDPFCCNSGWDTVCVGEVFSVCNNLSCGVPGTCSHGLCDADASSAPLDAGCDLPTLSPSCVDAVCAVDPFCCTTDWDSTCVFEVSTICGLNCG